MLTGIVYLIVIAVIVVLVIAARQPDCFQVQRKTLINSPPDRIFTLLNDLKQWQHWSPWEKKDLAMKKTFGAVTAGKDAVYEWDGDRNVGRGRMEITESIPPERLTIKLEFIKPFVAHNIVEFMLVPKGDYTEVVWDIHGPMPFMSKVMCLFISMDRMIGKDFEAGLASLKTRTEK